MSVVMVIAVNAWSVSFIFIFGATTGQRLVNKILVWPGALAAKWPVAPFTVKVAYVTVSFVP